MIKARKVNKFIPYAKSDLDNKECVINGLTVWQSEIQGTESYTINITLNKHDSLDDETCQFFFCRFFSKVWSQLKGYKKTSVKVNISSDAVGMVDETLKKWGFSQTKENGRICYVKTNFGIKR